MLITSAVITRRFIGVSLTGLNRNGVSRTVGLAGPGLARLFAHQLHIMGGEGGEIDNF